MEFTLVTAKSPEKLVDALNAEAKTVSIKALCGMMWQPHGAVVIVGYEKHAPIEQPATSLKPEERPFGQVIAAKPKKKQRHLVKELGRRDIGDSSEVIYTDIAGDSGGTGTN